jgi:hypothetical protein
MSMLAQPVAAPNDLVFIVDDRARWRSAGIGIEHLLPPFWIEVSDSGEEKQARLVQTAETYAEACRAVLKLARAAERDSGCQCWVQNYAAPLRGAR